MHRRLAPRSSSTPAGGDKVVGLTEDSMSYTLVVANGGPNATSGVVLQDDLPGFIAGQTVVSVCAFVGAGSCTPPSTANLPITVAGFNCALSGSTVTCNSGSNVLASGAGNAVSFVLRVGRAVVDSLSQSAVAGCSSAGQFCNQASVVIDGNQSAAAIDTISANDTARDFVQVLAVANLQTTSKTFLPALGKVGVDTSYTINYRNPASSGSNLPAVAAPPAGQPAGVIFRDVFSIPSNDAGLVLRSASIAGGAACSVTATSGGVVSAVAAGGTSYATTGGAAGTFTVECPRVTMARDQDRQVLITVRPNFAAVGPYTNLAGFRIVDSSDATVPASAATYQYNSDATAADDERSATLNLSLAQIDLRVENTDLQDPIGWDAAAVATSPGSNDIVYRVQVRNGGPSVASATRFDYTVTPPTGATLRFIGDEAGTAVTMASGALSISRCTLLTGSNPVVAPATVTLRCAAPGYGFSPNVDGVVAAGLAATDGSFLNLRWRYETAPAVGGNTVSTNAVVTAAEPESDISNNAEAEITTVRARVDLSINKSAVTGAVPALPAVLPAGVSSLGLRQPFTWVVDVANSGPGDSLSRDRSGTSPLNGSGTVVTDTLPAGVFVTGPITWQKTGSSSFVGAVPAGSGSCTQAALVLTCNLGDVAAGGRVRISVPVRYDTWPGGAGSTSPAQTNNASVASEQFDQDGSNNSTRRRGGNALVNCRHRVSGPRPRRQQQRHAAVTGHRAAHQQRRDLVVGARRCRRLRQHLRRTFHQQRQQRRLQLHRLAGRQLQRG